MWPLSQLLNFVIIDNIQVREHDCISIRLYHKRRWVAGFDPQDTVCQSLAQMTYNFLQAKSPHAKPTSMTKSTEAAIKDYVFS